MATLILMGYEKVATPILIGYKKRGHPFPKGIWKNVASLILMGCEKMQPVLF